MNIKTLPRTPTIVATAPIAALFAALLLLAACSKPAADQPAAPGKVRAELNVGYSLLYQQADGIPKMKWILMFKDKREALDQTTSGLMDYYEELAKTMEDLARRYPAVRLDAVTMPELMADTRKAIGKDLAADFAPLVGNTGLEFERELLLMFYNALDEQRHMVGVMIESEPDKGLLDFLQKTKAQLDNRRSKVSELLDRRYFRQEAADGKKVSKDK